MQAELPNFDSGLGDLDPFELDLISVEECQRPVGFRFYPNIINVKARVGDQELVVTGEATSRELAFTKAHAELIERAALILSDSYSSNGWAAHTDINAVRQNAIMELVERDAVLSQWYSSTPFSHIPFSELPLDIREWATEELARSEFPELLVLLSTKGIGPSVSCIFRNSQGFGVSGHGTRKSLKEALEAAVAEACRAAHFTLRREYWGETLTLKRGEPRTVEPGAHSVYYAYHEPFPSWIVGPTITLTQANSHWNTGIASVIENHQDFQFQTVLETPFFVGFVKHPLAFELSWGATSAIEVLRSKGAKRIGLESVNCKPHIVS